jgi:hypothetical protein
LTLRPEYDLRELLKGGVQGKYADRFQEGTNLVLLDRDVAEAFPNDEAVNEALRQVMQLKKSPPIHHQTSSAALRSPLVAATYLHVRLTPRDFASLASDACW